MKTWKRIRAWLLFLAVATGLYLGFLYVSLAIAAATTPDYGRQAPERVFAMLLGYPPPPGIANLRAEGKQALVGRSTVWLTFDFTDPALAGMLKYSSAPPLTGEVARESIRSYSRPFSRRSAARMRWVGWEESERIGSPELYPLPARKTNWNGCLILDRQRRRAYLRAVH